MKTPLEMFYQREQENAGEVFLRQSLVGSWQDYRWAEVSNRVRCFAAYFKSLNLPAESRIAVFARNCADWVVTDFAIMLAGHISVPLYPGQDKDSSKYILQHSGCLAAVLGDFDVSEHIAEILDNSVHTVAIHGCTVSTDTSLEKIVQGFEPYQGCPIPDPQSIFTMLYTSGTTGNPKGVMLRHGTAASSTPRMQQSLMPAINGRHRLFSYLPLSHAMERAMVEMNALYCNGVIAFSAGMASFFQELRDIQPTVFASVPRLWVKFKEYVEANLACTPEQLKQPEAAAEARRLLGLNEAVRVLTGSAPCSPDIHTWFADIGLALREGYSMTENFCDGCFWSDEENPIPGCVGRPAIGVDLKITSDNEICFRSDALMTGYYKEPEKTASVLVDGWYHTGDAGRIDEHGRLWVTGRIGETFKTSKGKFIQPVALEGRLMESGLFQQICVFGHGKDQPLAFVYLNDKARLMSLADLNIVIAEFLATMNSTLPSHERVPRIIVTPEEWTIQNGLLTPTLKMKRKVIQAHFESLV